MGRTIAGIAAGAIIAVLTVLAATYIDVRLDAAPYQEGDASDPYRMHRTLREAPMMFVVATSVLVYYALSGSLLMDRYMARSISSLSKSAVLSLLAWVGLVGWALSQDGEFAVVALGTAGYMVLPLFLGTATMLRVMSFSSSRDRDG